MDNFIITAMPRSGTKFLAQTMDRSNEFKVFHDQYLKSFFSFIRKNEKDKAAEYISDKLKDKQGLVSGGYRKAFFEIRSGKKGIILRNPFENILSLANMAGLQNSFNYIENLYEQLNELDEIASNDEVKTIKFKDMISDKDYLNEVLKFFGIEDVEVNEKTLKNKVNHKGNKIKEKDFPEEKLEEVYKKSDWFVKKYEL